MLSRWKHRTLEHQRALAGFAFLVFVATLGLLYAGGFTTTIGAGMVFADWPLSNGSLNPPGWTTDQAMAAEHGHRLLGATTGLLTLTLMVWTYLREGRRWVRRLSAIAFGLVVFQGLLGGLRVLLVSLDLANIHGVTAQIFLGTLVAVAVACSRWWRSVPVSFASAAEESWWQDQRRLGVALTLLVVAQLVIGSIVRHRGAGLAIPFFPFSTADGHLLPASWNWAVTIHFLHRGMALLISLVLAVWSWRLLRSPLVPRAVKRLGLLGVFFLLVQVALGAEIIWSLRAPIQTTLHVLNGAILLSVVWSATFAFYRPRLEGATGLVTRPAASPSPHLAPQRSW